MNGRWRLASLNGTEVYDFEINPNQAESPHLNRGIAWEFNGPALGWSGRREGRTPLAWSFSGVLRSQEQYEALRLWVGKRKKVRLTDDRGDSLILRLTEFSPTQVGGARGRHAPWRMTYTVNALVYEVQEATP